MSAVKRPVSSPHRNIASTQKAANRERAKSTRVDIRPTVLLVDDDPSFLPALARLVRSAGFRVTSFERPSALLANEIPTANACILIDVHMPEMNGVELCKRLVESGRGLPVIIISGRNDVETQRLMAEPQPVAALFKPVEEGALLEAIDRALVLSNSRSDK